MALSTLRLSRTLLERSGYDWDEEVDPSGAEQMFCNLSAEEMKLGARICYSAEIVSALHRFCARHAISAHALPSEGRITHALLTEIGFDTNDPGVFMHAAYKILTWIQRHISSKTMSGVLEETCTVPGQRLAAWQTRWRQSARSGEYDFSTHGVTEEILKSGWGPLEQYPVVKLSHCIANAVRVKLAWRARPGRISAEPRVHVVGGLSSARPSFEPPSTRPRVRVVETHETSDDLHARNSHRQTRSQNAAAGSTPALHRHEKGKATILDNQPQATDIAPNMDIRVTSPRLRTQVEAIEKRDREIQAQADTIRLLQDQLTLIQQTLSLPAKVQTPVFEDGHTMQMPTPAPTMASPDLRAAEISSDDDRPVRYSSLASPARSSTRFRSRHTPTNPLPSL